MNLECLKVLNVGLPAQELSYIYHFLDISDPYQLGLLGRTPGNHRGRF